ncbi:MAG: response regulator, partial [Alphaproteobacteria bacterium]
MNRIQIEFDELVEDEPKTSASAAEDDAAILASKILVVDDSPTTRELMRGCLIASGFSQVEVAGDGAEALRLAERNAPDLVVLDLAMPVLDGFDTCAALRRRSETRDVPVLVQSATEKFSDVTRAFDVGATDILGKPFKPIELTTRMRVHLENRQMIKRLVSYRTRVAQELDAAREMQQFLCPDPYMKRAASERHRVEIGSVYRP